MFFLSDEPLFTDEELLLMCAASGGKTDEATVTGNPLTFLTDLARPLKSLLIPFTPVQSGTGDPSPVNVRPFVPWNGLKVFGGGKNLLNPANRYASGNNVQYYRSWDRFLLKGGQTYIVSANVIPAQISIFKGTNTPVSTTTSATLTYTPTENVEVWFDFYVPNARLPEGGISAVYGMLEVGQTATAYEPYKPITETDISFPSPVYGGEHEAVSGKLMDGWKAKTFDGSSDEVWYFVRVGTTDYYRAYINMPDAKQPNSVAVFADSYKAVSFDNRSFSSKVCFMGNENETPVIFSLITDLTTLESFKAYLAENPLTIAYQLATPVEIQLTPTQLTALLGQNTIWSDADGSMTAVYLKKG